MNLRNAWYIYHCYRKAQIFLQFNSSDFLSILLSGYLKNYQVIDIKILPYCISPMYMHVIYCTPISDIMGLMGKILNIMVLYFKEENCCNIVYLQEGEFYVCYLAVLHTIYMERIHSLCILMKGNYFQFV